MELEDAAHQNPEVLASKVSLVFLVHQLEGPLGGLLAVRVEFIVLEKSLLVDGAVFS